MKLSVRSLARKINRFPGEHDIFPTVGRLSGYPETPERLFSMIAVLLYAGAKTARFSLSGNLYATVTA